MKKFFYTFTLLLFICFFQELKAQNTSNKGKDFWVAYSGHIDNLSSRLTLFLSADQATTYQVLIGSTTIASGTITANTCLPVIINPNSFPVYIQGSDNIEKNKAIRVITAKSISLYSVISNNARTGGTMVLPANTLGKEYYTFSYQSSNTANFAQFTIVATEDDTQIEITPTKVEATNKHLANQTFTKTLQKGDIYQYQAVADLSGSYIKSVNGCKPIAVFSGNTWVSFCELGSTRNPSGGDNLYQQVFPVSSWGKKFVTAPFYNTTNGSTDVLRIIVAEDNTVVTVNGSTTSANGTTLNNPYSKGAIITFNAKTPNVISASKPISVAHYQTSQTCNLNNPTNTSGTIAFPGDPEITVLNPVEQTLSNITVYSKLENVPTAINKYFLNVIIKTADASTFRLDGNPVTGFVAIDSEYSYVILNVTNLQPQHQLTASGGFSAIAYGYGNVESYAYLAGANIQNFTFQPENFSTGEIISIGCINEEIKLKVNLPYQTTKLVWNVNNGDGIVTQLNPVPISSFQKDGLNYYAYSYPNPIRYAAVGEYTLTVNATKLSPDACGATEELIAELSVDPLPTANFTVNAQACEDVSVSFTDKSIANVTGKTITKWLWDFGDGTTSTEQNPSHIYKSFGNMTVKLTVASESGCYSDVFTKDILINPKVVSAFQVNQTTCVDTKISFVDQSTIAAGSIVKWVWDMGDGKGTLEKLDNSPFLYEYSNPGTYQVKLITYSDKACVSVPFELAVKVSTLPVNNFSLPETCLSDGPAVFVNTSKDVDGTTTNLTYLWDFGDPASAALNTSTTQNGSHQYTLAGTYPVTLTITNANGCIVVYKQDFVVKPLPTADFSVNAEACEDVSISFTDKSVSNVSNRTITKWLWEFGDGTTSTEQNPTHVYQTFGNLTVKLIVETETGCISTAITKNILIHPKVVAKFQVNQTTCVNTKISFVDQSTVALGSIVKWVWDMGDGKPALDRFNNTAFLYEYDTPGAYTVKLVAHSDKGCVSVPFQLVVNVSVLPTNDFYLPDVCLSDGPAVFNNLSKDVDGTTSNLTYLWNFGDPGSGALNSSTAKDGSHKYNAAGNYNVSLTITNANGCVVKLEKVFTVNGIFPVAGFDVLNSAGLCSNKNISLVNTSTVDFGGVTKIEWFLDGVKHSEDTNPSPNKVYDFVYPEFTSPLTKNLTVKMVVYSGGTCSNEITKNLTLLAIPVVNFKTITPICLVDGTAFFENLSRDVDGTTTNLTYLWDFGDPVSGALNTSTAKDGVHKYAMAGSYNISLTITNANGCTVNLVQTILVDGAIPVAGFDVVNASNLCSNTNISLVNTSAVAFGAISKIEWYLDGVKHSEDTSPVLNKVYDFVYPKFTSPLTKNLTVKMVVYSGLICSDEITKNLTLLASPEIQFDPILPVCLNNAAFQLGATEIGGVVGVGFYSGVGVSNSGLFNPQIAGEGVHQITYTFTAANGCLDSKTQTIEVYPLPIVDAGNDFFLLVGGQKKIDAKAEGLNITYKWTPSIGLDKDDVLNPMANPAQDITYTLTVTSSQGCVVVDQVFVRVLQNVDAPNSFTPNGDGINDVWNIKYLDTYPNSTVEIYNRNGERVYYSKGYTNPFDGNYSNQPLPVGTYYYIINPNSGRKSITGSLTIIR